MRRCYCEHVGRARIALIPLALAACSGGDDEPFVIPALETDFAIYGTAPAGRALAASAVTIVPTTEIGLLLPEVIAGSDVDMMFAGLSEADLPSGLTPGDLMLVRQSDPLARALPMLHDPHVMDVPSPGEAPTPLVPVRGTDVTKSRSEEREARLFTLVSDLAIASPCTPLDTAFTVTTPRIPADQVTGMRAMSDGATFVAFSTTSTIIAGFIAPGSNDLEFEAVRTGTVTMVPGEVAGVYGIGTKEVTYDGRVWPVELAITYSGTGFGSVGALWVWDENRNYYVDRTPQTTETFPRILYGASHVTIDGTPNLCTYGGAQGSDRRAAIWCRPEGSTDWNVEDFGTSFGVTQIIERPGAEPIATDLAGNVWILESRGWRPIFESSINANCDPLCASFFASWRGSVDGTNLAIIGGSKAQLLYVRGGAGNVQAVAPTNLEDALFADERFGVDEPIQFSAFTTDPTGTTWYATTQPELFRQRPGEDTFERICLPDEIDLTPISAIHAREDGSFFLGMSPALFAYGSWR